MSKYLKIVVPLVLVTGFVLFGLYYFGDQNVAQPQNFDQARNIQVDQARPPQQEEETGQEEGQLESIPFDIHLFAVVRFERVDGGNIIYTLDADTRAQTLADEISVMCTTQNLLTATSLDPNLVVDVELLTPDEIEDFIPVNETVVIVAEENEQETIEAHTILVDSSVCEN